MSLYEHFVGLFHRVFDHSPERVEVNDQLFIIKEGNRLVAEFALEFHTIAAGSGSEPALKATFRQGLDPRILTKLAC